MKQKNLKTRLTDCIDDFGESKPLTEFKDGKYRLDFGFGQTETIFIETSGDDLLLITTQGTLKIHLPMLRIRTISEEVKDKWFEKA